MILVEIVFPTGEFPFEEAEELEEPLDEALQEADLGEVTGEDSNTDGDAITCEVTDFDAALAVIREVLQDLKVPSSTIIRRYDPGDADEEEAFEVWED